MQRVVISDGLYACGDLEYQTYNEDGTKYIGFYTGNAVVADGSITWSYGLDNLHIKRVTVAPYATKESTERSNGMEYARRQIKKRVPKNVSVVS